MCCLDFNIPIGIACLAITLTRVEESRDPRPRGIDWPGQLTLAQPSSLPRSSPSTSRNSPLALHAA